MTLPRRWGVGFGVVVAMVVALSGALRVISDDEEERVEEPEETRLEAGNVSLELPPGWVRADAAEGVDVPPAVVLVARDRAAAVAGAAFVPNLNVLREPAVDATLPMAEIVDAERAGIEASGGEIAESEVVRLDGRQAGRLQTRYSGDGDEHSTVTYILIDAREVWVLTYSFGVLDDTRLALADRSAVSFDAR